MKVIMSRVEGNKENFFSLQDDGDQSILAIDMIEDYQKNCYYSYVVKKGINYGMLFFNETQVFKNDYKTVLA
jgi:hypothetical protein